MAAAERYLGAMRVVEDAAELVRAGGWVIDGTSEWAEARTLVPAVFEDYARIFHPAMREADERDLPLRAPGESKTGVQVHPGMLRVCGLGGLRRPTSGRQLTASSA